jgi:hypothetical protein
MDPVPLEEMEPAPGSNVDRRSFRHDPIRK